MLGASNEKDKNVQNILFSLLPWQPKLVGVARYEKSLFFSIFELLQPFPQGT